MRIDNLSNSGSHRCKQGAVVASCQNHGAMAEQETPGITGTEATDGPHFYQTTPCLLARCQLKLTRAFYPIAQRLSSGMFCLDFHWDNATLKIVDRQRTKLFQQVAVDRKFKILTYLGGLT